MDKNKTALVTGASSGIGFQTAKKFAQSGIKVFAVARRKERLDDLARGEENIIPVCLDVTKDLSALQDVIGNVPIDILVNNAGGALGKESVVDAPSTKWRAMIDTNVNALIAVTQLVLPAMITAKSGDIVNIGSIAGFEYYAGGAAYCAAKAAVVALTKAWRQDLLGKGVRVIGIHPGMVNTEFSLTRFGGNQKAADAVYAGMTPLTAEDVASAIFWAVSCPRHVNVESLTLMPTDQAAVGSVWRG